MRWRFPDPDDREEAAARAGVQRRIDAWWEAFARSTDTLDAAFSGRAQLDVGAFMEEHLSPIAEGLYWEYGPAIEQAGHRLVITAEQALHLEPLIHGILERAPQLEGWEFYAHRVAESYDMAERTVEARAGTQLKDVRFALTLNDLNMVDIELRSKRIVDADAMFNSGIIGMHTLLGEHDAYRWLGDFTGEPGRVTGYTKMVEFEPQVRAAVAELQARNPERPAYEWAEGCDWASLKLEPEERDDYPHQWDLYVAISAGPCLRPWQASHSDWRFCSERYSRHGEVFAFLKLDGSGELDERFGDRGTVEDAINARLTPGGLGAVVGGGTGLRYSYSELALTDIDAAIPLIREAAQATHCPTRSWLLFHDDCWLAEWVGMWPDTPPPLLTI